MPVDFTDVTGITASTYKPHVNGARYSIVKTKDAYDKGKLSGHLSTSLYFLSKSLHLN